MYGYIKLMNGEEIIGTIKEDRDTGEVEISKPLKIMAAPTPQGIQIGLVSWINSVLPGANMSYSIDRSHIIVMGMCDPELAKSYKQQTSGIALS
jgi:hypothetical protein